MHRRARLCRRDPFGGIPPATGYLQRQAAVERVRRAAASTAGRTENNKRVLADSVLVTCFGECDPVCRSLLPGAGAGAGGARGGEYHSQPALAPGSERRKLAYQGEEEASSYYSQLAEAPDSAHEAEEMSERGKCDLVHRWLRRKLYEEVQEQVYACSRGLREVVPAGVLELFSAVELQVCTHSRKSSTTLHFQTSAHLYTSAPPLHRTCTHSQQSSKQERVRIPNKSSLHL